MKKSFSARSLRAAVIAGITAVSISTTVAATLVFSFGGAIYTTNSGGTSVNENIYDGAGAVFLNGGPNVMDGSTLPANQVFYFEVTNPSGKILLSKDQAACRQVETNEFGRIFRAVPDPECTTGIHPVGSPDGFGGVPVRLGPFEKSPNSGSEYKVILIRKNDPSVVIAADGKNLDYSMSAAKSDNFKVLNYTNDGGDTTPTNTNYGTQTDVY